MMKKFLIVTVGIFISSLSFAQSQADEIMKQVIQKVYSKKNVSIDFIYQSSANNNSYKGTLVLEKNKYRLNFMDVIQFFDGKKTYLINPNDEEVTISNHTRTENFSLTKILSNFGKDYTYSMVKSNPSKKGITTIKLLPKSKKSNIKEIYLEVNTTDYSIRKKTDYYIGGEKNILTVEKYITDSNLPKELFTFNKDNYSNYYFNYID